MIEVMILNYLLSLNGKGISPVKMENIWTNKQETRESIQKLLTKGKIRINDNYKLVLRKIK